MPFGFAAVIVPGNGALMSRVRITCRMRIPYAPSVTVKLCGNCLSSCPPTTYTVGIWILGATLQIVTDVGVAPAIDGMIATQSGVTDPSAHRYELRIATVVESVGTVASVDSANMNCFSLLPSNRCVINVWPSLRRL